MFETKVLEAVLKDALREIYEDDESEVLVIHDPMSPRYKRAERRRYAICYGQPIGWKLIKSENESAVYGYSNFVGQRPGNDYGEYSYAEITFVKFEDLPEPIAVDATIYAYYDGNDDSRIRAKTLDDAKEQERIVFSAMTQF